MALLHGKLGRIEWDADAARQNLALGQEWSLDISHDVEEITSMGDTWKTYLGGFMDWTATVTCLLDSAGSDVAWAPGNPNGFADVKAYLELYCEYQAGVYKMLYGHAVCSSISIGADANSSPTITYSFQGAGQVAWEAGAALKVY